MIKKSKIFLLILMASFIFSCSTIPVGLTSSTTPLHNKVIKENLGKTEGTDSAFILFNLWMIDKPDIDMAIFKALQKKGGDALINVRCYETSKWFLFFSVSTVKIIGDAVKFETVEEEKDENKKTTEP